MMKVLQRPLDRVLHQIIAIGTGSGKRDSETAQPRQQLHHLGPDRVGARLHSERHNDGGPFFFPAGLAFFAHVLPLMRINLGS
ncbi:MAG TPA: hypothetical protein VHZ32_02420 [Rhizomicrobium sp.]|nr:hypothetical protein [Rhizomicrobium sp.]